MNLDQAQDAVARTLGSAREQGVAVAVVVTDLGGRLVAAARMDGVGYVNLEVAQRKAVAAGNFGAPTHVVAELTSDPLLAAALSAVDDVLVLPGGFPLVDGDRCIGGLGIAGGHYSQDRAIGEAALAATSSGPPT